MKRLHVYRHEILFGLFVVASSTVLLLLSAALPPQAIGP